MSQSTGQAEVRRVGFAARVRVDSLTLRVSVALGAVLILSCVFVGSAFGATTYSQMSADGGWCGVTGGAVKCSAQGGDGTPTFIPGLNGVSSVSGSCALLASGGVRCRGGNDLGQLGDGSTVDYSPDSVSVQGVTDATSVSSNGEHACVALTGGTVRCWGTAGSGLGDGVTTSSNVPVVVQGVSGATSVASGGGFSCALITGGEVKCWGFNGSGRLGNGSTTASPTPVSVQGLSGATAITAGGTHACAIVASGAVRCWGSNARGELGDGTTTSSSVPVAVPGLSGVLAISAGRAGNGPGEHTCALLSDHTVDCWGRNDEGQLGIGSTTDAKTPTAVPALNNASAIAAGERMSCAAISGGGAKCWGANQAGQLGIGNSYLRPTPTDVIGLTGATVITTGLSHTCAVVATAVDCWGSGAFGEIGGGVFRGTPSVGPVAGVGSAVSVSAGGSADGSGDSAHTCALLAGGTVSCWGSGGSGQLGRGSTTVSGLPAAVGGGLSGATAVAAGWLHTCALVSGGAAKCWGSNQQGQLGNGEPTSSGLPVSVQGLSGATAITAGREHSCALVAGGAVECWGRNDYGQLGNNSTTRSGTPVNVQGLTGATAVSAGGYHTCAVVGGGHVDCWGNGFGGQLGQGVKASSSVPVEAQGVTDAIGIASGLDFTCAVLNGGQVKCWGYNYYGNLGNGTATDGGVPVAATVGGITGATAVTAGYAQTCALVAAGAGRCWGGGFDGQLGDGPFGAIDYRMLPDQVPEGASASPPGPPTGLTITPGDGRAVVSWSAPTSDGGSPVTDYTATADPGGQTCTTTGALSCTVTGLTNGTPYTFTVKASNAIGAGAASSPSAAATPISNTGGGGGSTPSGPTGGTTNPAPPTVKAITASAARATAIKALARKFKKTWTKSTSKKVSCKPSGSAAKCTISFRYRGRKYTGTATITATGTKLSVKAKKKR